MWRAPARFRVSSGDASEEEWVTLKMVWGNCYHSTVVCYSATNYEAYEEAGWSGGRWANMGSLERRSPREGVENLRWNQEENMTSGDIVAVCAGAVNALPCDFGLC